MGSGTWTTSSFANYVTTTKSMSMDDFVITYFTRGPGINTISTLVYSEVKRGIQPEMYALSTLLFLLILVLLLLFNFLSGRKSSIEV